VLSAAGAAAGPPPAALPVPLDAAQERGAARWGAALGRFRKAEAAIGAASASEDEDLYDRLGERFGRALRALLRTTAPDLHALAVKLDLAFAHEVSTLSGGEACLKAIQRDARRLARAGARLTLE
jgi:hypothetical protein